MSSYWKIANGQGLVDHRVVRLRLTDEQKLDLIKLIDELVLKGQSRSDRLTGRIPALLNSETYFATFGTTFYLVYRLIRNRSESAESSPGVIVLVDIVPMPSLRSAE